jgi:hypothetical protein
MNNYIGGLELVKMFESQNHPDNLVAVRGGGYNDRRVGGLYLKSFHLSYDSPVYDEPIGVGITLTTERRTKNRHPYYNLSMIKLSPEENNADTIDRLAVEEDPGIPGIVKLQTGLITIADGNESIEAYDGLDASPPESTRKLAEAVRDCLRSKRFYSMRKHQKVSPHRRIRIS